jgi:hypothetical protein
MTNEQVWHLARWALYKIIVCGIWFFSLVKSGFMGVYTMRMVYWIYLGLCIVLFFLPKRAGWWGRALICLIAVGNVWAPFLGFEAEMARVWGETLVLCVFLSPFYAFLFYYDFRVSWPKYKT